MVCPHGVDPDSRSGHTVTYTGDVNIHASPRCTYLGQQFNSQMTQQSVSTAQELCDDAEIRVVCGC